MSQDTKEHLLFPKEDMGKQEPVTMKWQPILLLASCRCNAKATRAQLIICIKSVPASAARPCTKPSSQAEVTPASGSRVHSCSPVRCSERLGWHNLPGQAKRKHRKSMPAPSPPSSTKHCRNY